MIEEHDRWVDLVLNRSARCNALSSAIYDGIHDAVVRAGRTKVAAIVIFGAGGYFCMGGDLNGLAANRVARMALFGDVVSARQMHDWSVVSDLAPAGQARIKAPPP